jgi:hypothetical protein
MKKIFFSTLIFISLLCSGQNIQNKANYGYNEIKKEIFYVPHPDTITLINITINSSEKLNGWGVIGNSCAGCPSYYYKIFRSKIPYQAEDHNFYYYFYFYFYSNSFLHK